MTDPLDAQPQAHRNVRTLAAELFLHRAFARFLLFGLWNALWSFALYALLVKVVRVPYVASLAIVWVIGFIAGYVGSFLWVFETDARLRFRRNLKRYVLLFWSSFAFNAGLLTLVIEILGVGPVIAQLVVIPIVVLLNYVGGRYWAFRSDR